MKIGDSVKKFFVGLLNVLLSTFIFVLIFSFYGKMVFSSFITELIGDVSTNIVNKNFVSENNKDGDKVKIERNITLYELISSSEYKALLKNKEVLNLVQKYIDITIDGMLDNKKLNDVKLEEDIINFLLENKTSFEKEYNVKISDDDIRKLQEDNTLTIIKGNYVDNVMIASAALSNTEKSMLKFYLFICSTTSKIILSVLILVSAVLIIVLQKSFSDTFKTIGVNVLTSGIFTIVLGIILHFVVNKSNNVDLGLRFDLLKISITGLVATIIGILILVACFVIKKIINKHNMEEMYDDVSNGFGGKFDTFEYLSADDE